jgi:hypothetical protein
MVSQVDAFGGGRGVFRSRTVVRGGGFGVNRSVVRARGFSHGFVSHGFVSPVFVQRQVFVQPIVQRQVFVQQVQPVCVQQQVFGY